MNHGDLKDRVRHWFQLEKQPIPELSDIVECRETRDPFLAACWPYFYVPIYREGELIWIRVELSLKFISKINRRRRGVSPRISDPH